MKVYLVHNDFYDYCENTHGSLLLGIYATPESAELARNDFITQEVANITKFGGCVQRSEDYDNNPIVTHCDGNEAIIDNVYVIEEWPVH